jgi:hypothetical protein
MTNKTTQAYALMAKAGRQMSVADVSTATGWTHDRTKAVLLNLTRSGLIARGNQPVVAVYGITGKDEPRPKQPARDRRVKVAPVGVFAWGAT